MSVDKSDSLREAALFYHENPRPGKLEIRATKPLANGRDLSRAYSPGVAEASLEIKADPANAAYFTRSARQGHAHFDLPRYTLDRLKRAGVMSHGLGRCTYGEPELFFSYRRSVHRGETDYGRLASAIMLA